MDKDEVIKEFDNMFVISTTITRLGLARLNLEASQYLVSEVTKYEKLKEYLEKNLK
jgi:hypothetical protein